MYAYVCVYIYANCYFLHISGGKHFLNDYPKANLFCLLEQNSPSNISQFSNSSCRNNTANCFKYFLLTVLQVSLYLCHAPS